MKQTVLAVLCSAVALACSSPQPPVDAAAAVVAFDAGDKPASTKPVGEEDTAMASASYVQRTGGLTIYVYGAVAPDKERRQLSLVMSGYRGGSATLPVIAAAYTRRDDASHDYGYQARGDAMKVTITDFELHDVENSPLQEGTISGTFEGEMQYIHPKKEGNAYTEPLKIANGKFSKVKVTAMK